MKSISIRKLCLFILLFPLVISAQSDYLVNTRGDTLKGTIRFQMVGNLEQASVKGLKKETYVATAVRRVYLKGIHYKPVQFSGTIKFMQIISDGYLSLLAFQPQGVMNYDGRLLQNGSTATMLFNIADLISWISHRMPLEPGDLIATGTPAGVAAMHTPPAWLLPGATVTVESSRLGRLINPIHAGEMFLER